jgi:HEAT repeat protein
LFAGAYLPCFFEDFSAAVVIELVQEDTIVMRLCWRFVSALLVMVVPVVPLSVQAASSAEGEEALLHDAGLPSDGAALTAFFQARARLDLNGGQLRQLLARLGDDDKTQRAAATTELLGLGSLALQALRQGANDIDHPDLAARAARCLPWLEGPSSRKLLIAAARLLGQRKPEGAAAALLAYLPFADDAEVVAAVNAALAALAASKGKTEPALLRGLEDRMGVRRAAAGVALCRGAPPDQAREVRKLLKDPVPSVRQRAALALAQAKDAEAIPILIDLLVEVSAEQRQPIEDCLKQLAGEWAPTLHFSSDDEITRIIRRDAWASWWCCTDGRKLLATLEKHTLTPDKRRKIETLIARLGSDDFSVREEASRQLRTFGRLALPGLRLASKGRDAETARRAKMLIERIDNEPESRLPLAALRLLAVRKPAGAVEALLAYLPFADDDERADEVRKTLLVLARRDGNLDATLRRRLTDERASVRALVAEVLIAAGGEDGRAAVRRLLREDTPSVRLRVALALARAGERQGIAAAVELLPLLSAEECEQAEDVLYQLAGDTAPALPEGAADDRKKRRDAWAAWWKTNATRVDPHRLSERRWLGYTLISDDKRLLEVDRRGKIPWS